MNFARLVTTSCLTLLLVPLSAWGQGLGVNSAPDGPRATSRNAGPLVAGASRPPDEAGRRYALVIGNADYKNVPRLNNSLNDGRAVCKMLRSLQFETDCYDNIRQRGSFHEAISDFAKKLGPNDVALFYYAGHGLELGGENYLVPTEADVRSKSYVENDTVRVNFVLDELSAASARLTVVILDACRSNPFTRVRSISGNGLAYPNSIPSGSIIIFPTSPGQVALDGQGENGVFTSHLLKHLPTAGITVEEMFKRVSSGVRMESLSIGKEQVPWLNLSFDGEFCFVGCGTRIDSNVYASVVKEKAEIEKTTQLLQAELGVRESELQNVRVRMEAMQKQFEAQEKSSRLSALEIQALAGKRDELAAKSAYLTLQQEELFRVKDELQNLRKQQSEHTKREQEILAARQHITALENRIAQHENRGNIDVELQSLRRERDALVKSNRLLQDRQLESEARQRELADQQQTRLLAYDQQQGDLETYKAQLYRLEVESRQKDESVRQMRQELENRQTALTSMRARMHSLQLQMQEQQQGMAAVDQGYKRLALEREQLARKEQELLNRERDLLAARELLARAEMQDSDQRAKQELIALQLHLTEYDKQKTELDSYRLRMARMEALQYAIQVELKQEREQRRMAEEKYKDAAKSVVKDAAFVPPAF